MNDDSNAEIQRRAYFIWERECRPEGRHLDHWLCAKAEIEAERSSASAPPDRSAAGQSSSAGATREKAPRRKA